MQPTSEYCPRCGDAADELTKRLIVETCGHKKCRKCLIKEENGCEDCKIVDASKNDCPTDQFNDREQINKNSRTFSGGQSDDEPKNENHKNLIEKVNDDNVKETGKTKVNKLRLKCPPHLKIKKVKDKTVFHCTVCNKEFKSFNNRKYHFYCDKSVAKPLRCDRCNKCFITKSHLKYHMKTHIENESHQCEICSRKFLRIQSLRKHVQHKHDRKFKHKCEICEEKFMYKEELVLHENKHNNCLPFKCEACNKSFSTKSNLKQHQQIHDGILHSCQVCNKTFRQSSSLKAHLLVHTDTCELECKECGKTFLNQKSFDRHLKTHSGSKTYQCPICGIKSTRRDNIQRHIRNLHTENNTKEVIQMITENDNNHEKVIQENNEMITEDAPNSNGNNCNLSNNNRDTNITDISNTISVIKYAGRMNIESNNIETDSPIENEQISNETQSVSPNSDTLIIDISENVNKEPLSNIKIYRQLLSPYLKPPQEVLNQTKNCESILSSNVNTLDSFSQCTENSLSRPYSMKKPFIKGAEYLKIYRRILLPDHDDDNTEPNDTKQMGNEYSANCHNVNNINSGDNMKSYETDLKSHHHNQEQQQYQHRNDNGNEINKGSSQVKDNFAEMHWRKRTSQCFNHMDF